MSSVRKRSMFNFAGQLRTRQDVISRFAEEQQAAIEQASKLVVNALLNGNKVVAFGNGGSASDAQHFVAEIVGRFRVERASLPALALTTNSSNITAIANDYGYENTFCRQLQGLGSEGDVVIGISTSGNSDNVVKAISFARDLDMPCIALTGSSASRLSQICDVCIQSPTSVTAHIQECHIAALHLICEYLDHVIGDTNKRLLPKGLCSLEDLEAERIKWKKAGLRVAWTNGCFDILHHGHLYSLDYAKERSDILIVGLNSDASVRQLKGNGRPFNNQSTRARLLKGTSSVDYVVFFEELTPESALSRVRPDLVFKGADYEPPNGKPIPELELVNSFGGIMQFIPLEPGISTSHIASTSGWE